VSGECRECRENWVIRVSEFTEERFFQYGRFIFLKVIWEKPYRETRLKRGAALFCKMQENLGRSDAIGQAMSLTSGKV
jgi:hypothetical protein